MADRDVARETQLAVEGLRERKKRLMHRLISDTATEMFLENGFDEVKVTDIAEACGVSEKTIYNYFPTKESLLLDREEETAHAIRRAFGIQAPARSPLAAALELLARDLHEIRTSWQSADNSVSELTLFRRFTELVDSTPSLRAAQREMMDRLVRVTAEAMAERAGVSADDPEPQIAAHSIVGLWRIQFEAIGKYADEGLTADEIYEKVTTEVRRAARLLESGLWSFGAMVQGGNSREQLKTAADAAQQAGRQVATALKQAKRVYRQIQQDMEHHGEHHERHQRPPLSWRGEQDRWRQGQREALRQDQREALRQDLRQDQERRRQANRARIEAQMNAVRERNEARQAAMRQRRQRDSE